ncbi:hypothetical protein GCM10023149_42330 [Mucilaginibacter gynuensis]|uniref:NigD-like protein n=1 Tax=Mucilaginibacter gynuensis TaxID=1302236 RepID=A0ABP8H5P3_9SPHI
MKHRLPILFALCLLALSSCKKDEPIFTGYDLTFNNQFQSLKAGEYWEYESVRDTLDVVTIATVRNTITGGTTLIDDRLYHNVNTTIEFPDRTERYPRYFRVINHEFSIREIAAIKSASPEYLYLIDTAKVGASWSTRITDNGLANGLPVRLVGTLLEKDVVKEVNGTVYAGVSHTHLQVLLDLGTGTGLNVAGTYDYYIAKGVGIIQMEYETLGGIKETQTLTAHVVPLK